MISSQAEEMSISWGVEKEFNRATFKPIGFTSGPEAQQSSGISLSGGPCLACTPALLLALMCRDQSLLQTEEWGVEQHRS